MSDNRLHAVLSPSAASRWLTCTPSSRLEQEFDDSTSGAAREGTLAHSIGELLITFYSGKINRHDYEIGLGNLIESDLIEDPENGGKMQEFYCPAMQQHCEDYATYVMEQYAEAKKRTPDAQLYVEQRLDISAYVPECFGTGDVGIISDRVLHGIDLKYGKGVEVSAVDNSQMKVYALGWLEEYGMVYTIDTVRMTIYQPRMGNYSTWEISVTELQEWAETQLRPKAVLAFAGEGDFVPGGHCQFCRAKPTCKALADFNLELAKYDFAVAKSLTDAELSDIYGRKKLFESWLKAVGDHMLREAVHKGKQWPGYKLVEGRSDRVIGDPGTVAASLLTQYDELQVYNKKLKGLGDLEKLCGKTEFAELVAPYLIKPPGSPTLAPDTDKRPAYSSAGRAAADFAGEDDSHLM